MTRLFWDKVSGDFIPYDSLPPRPKPKGPIILGDSIPDSNGRDVWNPADGRTYSSKSEFYAATKRAGGTVIGNDRIPRHRGKAGPKKGEVANEVKRAIAQLNSR